jgi:hypothetical protein
MPRIQCYFALQSYLHFHGYYITILTANNANKRSKYFSSIQRRILEISDEYSDLRTAQVLRSKMRRLQFHFVLQS